MKWRRLAGIALTLGALSLPHDAHAVLHAGDTAPDFRATDLAGISHTLFQYRGQVVVLFILGHS